MGACWACWGQVCRGRHIVKFAMQFRCGVAVIAFALLTLTAGVAQERLILEPVLTDPARLSLDWTLDGSGTWTMNGGLLALVTAGTPSGPIRRPSAIAVLNSPVFGARRSGRGSARWCTGGPICCRPFRLTVPHSPLHHSVSDPRHIEPDRRISRIRLTAKASSIEVMLPFGRCALSRWRTRGGSPERGPTSRTRCRYSTASNRIPCACAAWPRIVSPCARRGI